MRDGEHSVNNDHSLHHIEKYHHDGVRTLRDCDALSRPSCVDSLGRGLLRDS